MKTPFLRALLLAGVSAPASFAFSLYDTAPAIGLPESHAIAYNAYATIGYDDNLNSSSRDKEDGMFAQAGVGASYSDQEAATKISYNVSLGARVYDRAAENSDREFFADCSLSASLSHSFSAGSVYSTSLSATFSPDLNLASAISASYEQGESARWSWTHAYSQAIDARWSWSVNASYSGNLYTRGSYQEDDRQYLSGGLSLSYRYSSLTTYSVGASYSHDIRSRGENSDNVYLNLSVNHSLTPVSGVYATVGTQTKFVAGESDVYPNFRFGYRRTLAEGLSANLYFSYDNENIDTGYSRNNMYLSDQTIRTGVSLSYAMTHKVTLSADASVLDRQYSKHTGGAADRSDTTWVLGLGMSYKFTKQLSGHINYKYTNSEQQWGDYDRNVISTGVSYSF